MTCGYPKVAEPGVVVPGLNGSRKGTDIGGKTALERMCEARRIIICACGTSWHAGLIGEYVLESLARIPVEVASLRSADTTRDASSCLRACVVEADNHRERFRAH